MVLRRVGDDQGHRLRGQLLAHALELDLHDLADLGLGERLEDDGRVDPVQEFRPEEALHLVVDALLHVLVGGLRLRVVALALRAEAERALALQHLLREVAGHDDDRVPEVDGPALGVGQAPFVEDLQQDVEDLGMGLLDLVEQDHAVAFAADRLGELATLFVPDVAGWRPDEARHVVPLHVVGHVDLHHVVDISEHELGERASKVGLAGAGRADEEERADRPARVLQPGAGAADGAADRLDGFVLSDDLRVQRLFHLEELLGLLLGEPADRDPGPHRDDLGDVLVGDLGPLL